MSRIFNELQCEHCRKEFKDLWISFGHPKKDLKFPWTCKECGASNVLLVKAMPKYKVEEENESNKG